MQRQIIVVFGCYVMKLQIITIFANHFVQHFRDFLKRVPPMFPEPLCGEHLANEIRDLSGVFDATLEDCEEDVQKAS